MKLRRRRVLPAVWKFPRIDLPRVRVDFPEQVAPPWREIPVDRVIFARLDRDVYLVKVTFDV